MELWNQTAWYVETLYNVLLFILPTLAGVAVAGPLGLGTVRFFKQIAQELRPAIDEPTDLLVRLIADKSGRTPEQVSAFLIANLDKVIAALPNES